MERLPCAPRSWFLTLRTKGLKQGAESLLEAVCALTGAAGATVAGTGARSHMAPRSHPQCRAGGSTPPAQPAQGLVTCWPVTPVLHASLKDRGRGGREPGGPLLQRGPSPAPSLPELLSPSVPEASRNPNKSPVA